MNSQHFHLQLISKIKYCCILTSAACLEVCIFREAKCIALTPIFMATKSRTKILNFSTRFSCKHFAVEDFVKLPMGKKSCRWGNVMFGHSFDKLVQALLWGGDTKFKLQKAGRTPEYFFFTRG